MKSGSLWRLSARLRAIFAPFQMLIVTGTYWGDEGKGKIVDLLSAMYQYAIRFSGGAGAGHTLVTPGGQKFIGHLIPCGIARRVRCVLGRGVFSDLKRFCTELDVAKGVFGENLPPIWVDKYSPVWTQWHELLEKWLEYAMGKKRVQTTGKAIGPLAGLRILRAGIEVRHLYGDPRLLRQRLTGLYVALKPCFDEMVRLGIIRKKEVWGPSKVERELLEHAPRIERYVTDTASGLFKAFCHRARLLFEAAQAPGLDIDLGTWPYVSAGHSVAAGAPLGTGMPLRAFARAVVLMVMKALPTRVGAGPFPSEIWDRKKCEQFALDHPELFKDTPDRIKFLRVKRALINAGRATAKDWAQYFQVLGYELGATTGRGRSVGWMDIMWLHYVIRINGPRWFALTRFDMLSGLKYVPVVVGYKLDGKRLQPGDMPDTDDLYRVEPIIENWKCWDEDITGISDWKALPYSAKQFIWKLEKLVGVRILLIGTGPARHQIIVRSSAAKKKVQIAA
ncbi:MAG: adenylosuccinate synthetase [Patescibacteria group bacterium]|nr:adenylosuccinate synthetase [Patescibacteria group bacterium]MDD5715276.1 adenylosuccinate synthetase [Patescibacteria group bacterium]